MIFFFLLVKQKEKGDFYELVAIWPVTFTWYVWDGQLQYMYYPEWFPDQESGGVGHGFKCLG